MRSPTGRILEYGIYRTDAGLEARMGYGEQLLASQYTSDVDIARATAQVWREALLENPKFQELPRVDVPSIGTVSVRIYGSWEYPHLMDTQTVALICAGLGVTFSVVYLVIGVAGIKLLRDLRDRTGRS
jgi:hypothetical protein